MRAGSERLKPIELEPIREIEEARLRREVSEELRTRLRESEEGQGQAGKVFFEGAWMTPMEAHLAYMKTLRQHRRVFWELVLLFGLLALGGALAWLLTYRLCCG